MLYIIYLVGGILIGLMVATFLWVNYIHFNTCGTLKKQTEDGETYLFLDLDVYPEKILTKQRVVFKVDPKDMVPRE